MPSPFRSFVASANVLSRPFCFHEWKIAPSVLRSSSSSSSSATPLSSSLLLLESTPIPISESSFLSFFFAPRLDGHRSRSIALSHSRISRIRLRRTLRLVLYLLSLSFSSLLLLTLSLALRTLGPRRSCAHALLFSLARAACFPLSTDSCDRRSLQFGCFSLRRVVARVG